jgi:hypothetical protein
MYHRRRMIWCAKSLRNLARAYADRRWAAAACRRRTDENSRTKLRNVRGEQLGEIRDRSFEPQQYRASD